MRLDSGQHGGRGTGLQRTFGWLVMVLFAAILLFLLALSLFQTAYQQQYETTLTAADDPLIHLLNIAAVTALLALAKKPLQRLRPDNRLLYGILAAATLAAGCLLIFTARIEPAADQRLVLDIARQFAAGKPHAAGYLKVYPNNLGLMFYFVLCHRLAGGADWLLIQFFNLLWLLAVHYSLWRLCAFMFDDVRVERVCLLLLFGFTGLFLYVPFVYGNLAGLALALLAVLCQCRYAQSGKTRYGTAAAALMALALCLRGSVLIILVGMLIFYLLQALAARKWRPLAMAALTAALALAANQGLLWGYAALTGAPPPQGLPAITWVVLGLDESDVAPGWWHWDHYEKYILAFEENGYDPAPISALAWQELGERLSAFAQRPLYFFYFMYKKAASMWNHPDFQGFWLGTTRTSAIGSSAFAGALYTGWAGRALRVVMNRYQSLVLAGGLAFAVANRKKWQLRQLLLATVFVGGFLFHLLFWEAKAQYAVSYFVLLAPYAAAGLCALADGTARLRARLQARRAVSAHEAQDAAAHNDDAKQDETTGRTP